MYIFLFKSQVFPDGEVCISILHPPGPGKLSD